MVLVSSATNSSDMFVLPLVRCITHIKQTSATSSDVNNTHMLLQLPYALGIEYRILPLDTGNIAPGSWYGYIRNRRRRSSRDGYCYAFVSAARGNAVRLELSAFRRDHGRRGSETTLIVEVPLELGCVLDLVLGEMDGTLLIVVKLAAVLARALGEVKLNICICTK
ncbi:hypothetical protein DM02DRAFT_439119 [Periconia macrospinosa]|uniref:Uncharacterized protein n=1 Tax=Periconia macrospinosa TaxID=97972 RepID=A0A2V1DMD6_9PLEO|nr:hypothetical protein DM02DRAFT_439119 [Periconia macrospinosa]